MTTIVVPLDGSVRSERSIPLAVLLARATGATLHLAHVLPERNEIRHDESGGFESEPSAFAYLEGVARGLPSDISARTVVVAGAQVERFLRAIDGTRGAMVVMATRARRPATRAILGSFADSVIRDGIAPVALVRATETVIPPALRRILVPLDGSSLSEAALPLAAELASASGARLVLFHQPESAALAQRIGRGPGVSEATPGNSASPTEAARAYLDRVAAPFVARGVVVESRVGVITPSPLRLPQIGREIAQCADVARADAIVMATHGYGGMTRWALGSVTDEVIYTALVPVIVVPPDYAASLQGNPASRPVAAGR